MSDTRFRLLGEVPIDRERDFMATKTATALALAVNELLTNAAKHSDVEEESAIRLCLHRDDQKVYVTIEDNGPGFPPGFDPSQQAGIGLSLVLTLIEHELRGRVRLINIAEDEGVVARRGARVEITFSASSLQE